MRIVLIGTGTNIGKTHLGVALVTAMVRRGLPAVGLKPVESGVVPGQLGEDAQALADASRSSPFHVKQGARPQSEPAQPYALPDPVSPHLAARRAGVTIDLAKIAAWLDAHTPTPLLIETAGALLSPLTPTLTNLDLARAARPDRLVLVAVDRLGVLHDVAACMHVLRSAPELPAPIVVLQSPAAADTSTGTNAEELVRLGVAPVVFTMPRGSPASAECQAAALQMLKALGCDRVPAATSFGE
ncbi:MAG: dethiobiotin synthase [Polyangiaceae bacterium]